MSKVSVIIPTFNRSHIIERAIQSVVDQNYKNIELIIVDDGSVDNTKEIVSKYDCIYIKTENHGVSHARNQGVDKASGEWIAFLDSDDQWLPKKLESQLSYLNENPNCEFIHTNEIWIRNGVRVNPNKKYKKAGADQFIPSLKLCAISPSTVLMSKKLFFKHGGFREDYPCCEDYDLWLKITSEIEVGYLEEFHINKFGGHEDQLSHKYKAMDYYRVKSLYWILKNKSLSNIKKEALLKVLNKKCEILIKGFIKHNNLEHLDEVKSIQVEINI